MRRIIGFLRAGLSGRAAILGFLLTAGPSLIVLALLVPLGEAPDEPAHIARAAAVLNGDVIGHRVLRPAQDGRPAATVAGFDIDFAYFSALAWLPSVPPGAPKTLTRAALATRSAVTWTKDRTFVEVSNTANYLPLAYLPGALGIGAARLAGAGPFVALHVGRLAQAAAYLALGMAALLAAPGRRALLLALLLMPMSLSLGAAIHQDGMLIAASALAAALIARAIHDGRFYGWGTAILALVIASKPPYLPLAVAALLPWMIGRMTLRRCLAGGVVAVAPALLWSALAALVVTVPFGKPPYHPGSLWTGDPSVTLYATDAAAQIRILLAQPSRLLMVPLRSAMEGIPFLTSEFVGVLAWLDLSLPRWAYSLWFAALGCALAADLGQGGRTPTTRRPWLAPVAVVPCVLAAILLLYLVQYLTWTDVGRPTVDGVQGRYFIPIAALASLGLPLLPRWTWPHRAATPLSLAPLAMGVIGIAVLPVLVVYRYYIGP